MNKPKSNENMKVVILAGGFGTRISEETHSKPKPLIEIGEKPILWHIMKHYSHYGFNDFIICLGYKGEKIKEYFSHYFLNNTDITFDFKDNSKAVIHRKAVEPWTITLVDTGRDSMTGGRLKRVQEYVGDNSFLLTYGDGLCDVNLQDLVNYHQAHGKLATVTAVQPSGRFGTLKMNDDNLVNAFQEKLKGDGGWINGGFFVMESQVFDYINGDETVLEQAPLENLANDGELVAFKHRGFWQCMDTLKDRNTLEKLWASGNAPWKLGF